MSKLRRYKSTRKYRCPYCDKTATRDKLGVHVEEKHSAELPEGYTGARAVYDFINKKNYGTCLICKKKVYEWDDKIGRYKNICDNPRCLAALKERAGHNHLEDPEVQKKLLEGRKISGHYTFSDGITHSYVGSYERNCFEFMDTVMNIPGKDIMSPGPVIMYEYEGETHPWILDWMYIPAMLCCDVKDGGNNPNTRPMEDYRARQIAKEEAIEKLGTYNYIRLTDNNFGQLLSAFAEIRMGNINLDPDKHMYINESSEEETEMKTITETVGCMPSARAHCDYIVPRMMSGLDFEDRSHLYFGNTRSDKILKFDAEGNPIFIDKKDVDAEIEMSPKMVLSSDNAFYFTEEELRSLGEDGLIEKLTGKEYHGMTELLMEKVVDISNTVDSDFLSVLITNGMVKNMRHAILDNYIIKEEYIDSKDNVVIYKDEEGYYMTTPDNVFVSPHYQNYVDITPEAIALINNMYNEYIKRGGVI